MSEHVMRAKLRVAEVTDYGANTQKVVMRPVAANKYPADGTDEDNTYAKFSPSGQFELTITNPALLGKLKPGMKLYADFSVAPE